MILYVEEVVSIENFPEVVARELAEKIACMQIPENETEVQLNVRQLPAGTLIRSFMRTLIMVLQQQRPEVVPKLTFVPRFDFQKDNFSRWYNEMSGVTREA